MTCWVRIPAICGESYSACPRSIARTPLELHVARSVPHVLEATPERLDPGLPLVRLGPASLMTVELMAMIQREAGVQLAKTQEDTIRLMEPYHDERCKWFEPFAMARSSRAGRKRTDGH